MDNMKQELLLLLINFMDDESLESRFIDYCIEQGENQEDVENMIDEFKNDKFR